jgi:hypothetical protein
MAYQQKAGVKLFLSNVISTMAHLLRDIHNVISTMAHLLRHVHNVISTMPNLLPQICGEKRRRWKRRDREQVETTLQTTNMSTELQPS